MIVDQAVYRDGQRQPCEDLSDELTSMRNDPEAFLWVGLKDPTTAEFDEVKDELGLHPLAVEDAVTGNQRAKIERYGDHLLVVLKTLQYTEATSQVSTGEVLLFVGPHYVLTVRYGDHSPLQGIRRHLEQTPALLAHGPIAVLHRVLDDVVDQYGVVDGYLEEDLAELEEAVFSSDVTVRTSRIYLLKREVLEVRRAAHPLVDSSARLLQSDLVPDDARPYFRDVQDHLLRVVDQVDSYDRLLTDVLSAHLAQVGVQQNEDMRKISAWVAIGVLPTLVGAVYGMNFHYMPELEASVRVNGSEFYYGYFVALAAMGGLAFTLYRLFRRSGWL